MKLKGDSCTLQEPSFFNSPKNYFSQSTKVLGVIPYSCIDINREQFLDEKIKNAYKNDNLNRQYIATIEKNI